MNFKEWTESLTDENWDELRDSLDDEEQNFTVADVSFKLICSERGDGYNSGPSSWLIVVESKDFMFAWEGSYDSWGGRDMGNIKEIYEVKPKQETITIYEAV